MKYNLSLRVRTNKPLSSYGDGHVIVYDANAEEYYMETRENFLSEQNAKILTLEKRIEKFMEDMNESKRLMEENYNEFKEQVEKNYSKFIEEYKETNQKMINLIKETIMEEENNGK